MSNKNIHDRKVDNNNLHDDNEIENDDILKSEKSESIEMIDSDYFHKTPVVPIKQPKTVITRPVIPVQIVNSPISVKELQVILETQMKSIVSKAITDYSLNTRRDVEIVKNALHENIGIRLLGTVYGIKQYV